MPVRVLAAITDAPGALWQSATDYPFLSLPFLAALERSGAVSPATGWTPHHLLLEEAGQPKALLPLYRKTHSRGEYVFDHGWAEAYHRHGLDYYPRLVSAIPFTPVPGPRCLLAPGVVPEEVGSTLLAGVRREAKALGASSWHGLFLPPDWPAICEQQGLALRRGCQFAWRDQNYGDFEGFLAALTSKRRKTLRAERRRVVEQGVRCRRIAGPALVEADWDFFYRCYKQTYAEHGQRPYLSRGFFSLIAATMAPQVMLVQAEAADGPVACALFFRDSTTLYGRYWGALANVDCLHFEVCYYQGIEYCLEQGLGYFDPGTQGEHKLSRGFGPVLTCSAHWLAEPAFMAAVQRFVREEESHVRNYQQDAMQHLPFRQESGT